MYQQALQIAKQTGDGSKQRRLDRGLRVSGGELTVICSVLEVEFRSSHQCQWLTLNEHIIVCMSVWLCVIISVYV